MHDPFDADDDGWHAHKDDLAMGLINEDGSYREPDVDAPELDEPVQLTDLTFNGEDPF